MGGLKNVYVHGIFTKKLVKQRGVLSILGHGRVKGMIKQNEIGKSTRVITMRSKPNYVEFVLLQLLLMLLLWFLLL